MLLLALSVAARVLVGVGDVDGTATVIGTAAPHPELSEGHLTPICTVNHRRGFVPEGVVVDDHRVVFAVAADSGRDADVVVLDLLTCGLRTLTDEAIPLQAPVVIDDHGKKVVVVVKQIDPQREGARFEIVAVDVDDAKSAKVLTARDALWITPVRGAKSLGELRFLVGDGDGEFHVDKIDNGDLAIDVAVGKGVFHSPVLVSNALLIEKQSDKEPKKAVLIDKGGNVVAGGLAGLSPVVDGAHLAYGNGKKDGGVVKDGVARRGSRAGIARPQLLAGDDVVFWLDRGAALPGELWLSQAPVTTTQKPDKKVKRAVQLLPATKGKAVKVYGVIK